MRDRSEGRTKIVCTLGPSTQAVELLVELIRAGVDVFRLNFSHGTQETHRLTLEHVHRAMQETGKAVAVLQDLQGPKIRVGDLALPALELKAGGTLIITTEPIRGEGHRISTTYAHLPADVHGGDRILLDDGKLELRVRAVHGSEVSCDIITGGLLAPHKGINLPGVPLSTPSCTAKDLEDLTFGLEQDVDYVALSFVRSAKDLRDLKSEIARRGKADRARLIAKIEKPEAVEEIDAIMAEADAIMIARGDLGVELPPEDVPVLQKRIIAKCNGAGIPVIVATQMLESMISNPAPTRAETNDVANAVLDGSDAVMLSGETSVGKFPLEAVRMMNRIILRAEADRTSHSAGLDRVRGEVRDRHEALGEAACVLAEQMGAAAIIAVTRSGQTARVLSHYRPACPIVAVTAEEKILRQLSLVWGVRGLVEAGLDVDSDRALHRIQRRCVEEGWVEPGEYVVLLGGQPFLERGSTNFLKVEKIA